MKPKVLIVDDSLTVRMDLGEALDLAGFQCTLCATLLEARQALSKNSFALIILDVLLPDGDGVEFLRSIRSAPATAGTPVMLLSSEADVRDRVRGLNTGADEYVGKPYDQSYVVARARELLRKKEPEGASQKAKTVLVIDDSPTFREELKAALESSGYSVVTAGTGEEGLRAALDARPAVIVVDGVLPGIDGSTVIRRVRGDAVLRSTPCILLTASEERSGELRALEAGADAYVRKEEDTQVILARVTAVLRSSGVPSTIGSTSSLLGPKRILTVDDSLTYLHEVASQLREEGYEVIPAQSGEEALELLSVQTVDCILLDLVMPGLSGQETCRRIKGSTAWRDIPLIMHTALEEQEAMIEGINAGADDYIAKSSDLEVLRARVRAQLRRNQFEDENRNIREQLLQKELQVTVANSARELAETRAAFVEELERKNSELEAFSYSVSHDLRAPLRSIDGFSQLLLQDHARKLDEKGKDYLRRVSDSAKRMSELIDDLLLLSRVGRAGLTRDRIDISGIAQAVFDELKKEYPERRVQLLIAEGLLADADSRLMRVALENLLGNAWKFTSKVPEPCIEIGVDQKKDGAVFFIRCPFLESPTLREASGMDGRGSPHSSCQNRPRCHEWARHGTAHNRPPRRPDLGRRGPRPGRHLLLHDSLRQAWRSSVIRSHVILLVEDNPNDVELTLRAFEKSKVINEIVVVRDGEQAIQYLFSTGPHSDRNPAMMPEVVLLDMKLPKIDGLGVLRRMRADERTRRLPVVILTSSKEERDVASSYDLGANSFVRKPVDFGEFVDAARHLGIYWLVMNEPAPRTQEHGTG